MPEEKKDIIFKTFRTEVREIDDKEGIIDMLIPVSTGSVDRHGEAIDPMGWKKTLKIFKKHPVLISSHQYGGLKNQIGEFIEIKATPEGLLAKPKYYINQGNDEADWGFRLASMGVAAYSVGFIPIKWQDAKEKPTRTYTEQELVEISHVIVPSNRDAIQKMQGKSEDPIVNEVIDDILKEEGLIEVDEGEPIELAVVEKPYPNEHACRIRNPGDFKPESFRRVARESDGKKYFVIMGRLKGETTMTEQSYRYNKDVWTVAQARKHCKDHDGILFEPATGKTETDEKDEKLNKLKEELKDYPQIKYVDIEEDDEDINIAEKQKEYIVALIVRENKELIEKNKELELKVGAVLNAKNKQNLKNAQNLIQTVLDSAETGEDSLEIEDEKDVKDDNTVIDIEDDKKDDEPKDKEEDKDTIEIDEKVIAKAVNDQMGYILGKVKK